MKLSMLREEWAKKGLFQTTTPPPAPEKQTTVVMGPNPFVRQDTTLGGRVPSLFIGNHRPLATSYECDNTNHDACTVPWCECKCHDADCWGGNCWGG